MKRARGFVWISAVCALAALGLGRRAAAADLRAQPPPEDSIAVTAGAVALTLSANVELQTRWGPVVGVGIGERFGPAFNAYLGETVPIGSRWAVRPGFRFVRSWQTVEVCPTVCTFDFYVGELALRYRGPSGFLFEWGIPLFGWLPVGPNVGETQPHPVFYTLATGELAFASTVLFGFTFDL